MNSRSISEIHGASDFKSCLKYMALSRRWGRQFGRLRDGVDGERAYCNSIAIVSGQAPGPYGVPMGRTDMPRMLPATTPSQSWIGSTVSIPQHDALFGCSIATGGFGLSSRTLRTASRLNALRRCLIPATGLRVPLNDSAYLRAGSPWHHPCYIHEYDPAQRTHTEKGGPHVQHAHPRS